MSMKDASAVPAHMALGKKLPGKLRKLQHLPPRAKIVFICTVVDSLNCLLEVKDMGKKEKGGKEAVDEDEPPIRFPEDVVDNLLTFGLHRSLSVRVPTEHHGVEFLNPMVAVLVEQHKMAGSRLKHLSMQDIMSNKFGFFFWDKDEPTKVTTFDKKECEVEIPKHSLNFLDKFVIVNNHCNTATLECPATGFKQDLHALFKLRLNEQFAPMDEPFEHIAVTDKYKDMAPKKDAVAKAKASAKDTSKLNLPSLAKPKRFGRKSPRT
jgi:hypothetical protein